MERTYTVDELLGAVKRRWRWTAVVAAAVFAVAALVIARLPSEYRTRALVMVEPLHPHPDLVVPVISRTLEERVKSVRSQVYARQLMATAIEELNLYPQAREKDGMDAAVEALRNDTEVHGEGDDAFSITVRSRDAALAAKTANRLAELFIEGNLQVRAGQVARTRDVITQQLAQMRGELSKSEAKISAFKRASSTSSPSRSRWRRGSSRQPSSASTSSACSRPAARRRWAAWSSRSTTCAEGSAQCARRSRRSTPTCRRFPASSATPRRGWSRPAPAPPPT